MPIKVTLSDIYTILGLLDNTTVEELKAWLKFRQSILQCATPEEVEIIDNLRKKLAERVTQSNPLDGDSPFSNFIKKNFIK